MAAWAGHRQPRCAAARDRHVNDSARSRCQPRWRMSRYQAVGGGERGEQVLHDAAPNPASARTRSSSDVMTLPTQAHVPEQARDHRLRGARREATNCTTPAAAEHQCAGQADQLQRRHSAGRSTPASVADVHESVAGIGGERREQVLQRRRPNPASARTRSSSASSGCRPCSCTRTARGITGLPWRLLAMNCTSQRPPNISAPVRPISFHGDMCRPVHASHAIGLFMTSVAGIMRVLSDASHRARGQRARAVPRCARQDRIRPLRPR